MTLSDNIKQKKVELAEKLSEVLEEFQAETGLICTHITTKYQPVRVANTEGVEDVGYILSDLRIELEI